MTLDQNMPTSTCVAPSPPGVNGSSVRVVGIGASAGGLEAIGQLVAHLPPDLPCAYVVLQHLSPTYRSMMVEILARETPLAVRELTNGDPPQAGVIYVVPPNHNATIKDGRLHLQLASPETVPKPSINQFFISLAAEAGEAAVGIVLSGTGSDGVAGLRAIQAAGGVTIAQKPETAKYDGMPRAAIDAGVVDHVLAPEEIAAQLPDLLALAQAPVEEHLNDDLLQQLLARLRERTGLNFSGYKTGTLLRRVRRREIATGCADFASYLRYIDADPHELDTLGHELLISVTAFFRDTDAFAALQRAIAKLVAHKPAGSEIRFWVAGCATGEEAYSLAILLAEALGERLRQYRIQIFATDIDEEALNVARRGVYPSAAVAEVAPDWVERYFRPQNNQYEVIKTLRDLIVFARHNLVSDPPFLRLDLVSCRNVLIYFDTALQNKVLQTLHFALVPGGYLFLGKSEGLAQCETLFSAVDRRHRLYQKGGESAEPMPPETLNAALRLPAAREQRERRSEQLLHALAQYNELTAALCAPDGAVLYSVGATKQFFHIPAGAPRHQVFELVTPGWRGELLALWRRCQESGKAQHGRPRKMGNQTLRLHVAPCTETNQPAYLVWFQPERALKGKISPIETEGDATSQDELVATREHLQTLIEELATANEELQSLHEEAQAANEELQATNEELEAANQELQATNEELVSVNEELRVKTQELKRLNNEYEHLYDALEFPLLVFAVDFRLRRYNRAAAYAYDLRPSAIGLTADRLRCNDELDLETQLGRVLAHGEREERLIERDERIHRLVVTPGCDDTGQVSELIVTVIDVTDLLKVQRALAESQARLSALMEKTLVLFALKDLQGRYLYANERFRRFFDIPANYEGKTDFELLPPLVASGLWQGDLTALRQLAPVHLEHVLARENEQRHLVSTHQVLLDPEGKPTGFMLEAEDVTEMRLAEEQLRIAARVFDQSGEAIVVTDPKGIILTINPAFTRITGYEASEAVGKPISLLKSGRQSQEFYTQMWHELIEHGHWQGEIWNKRKDGTIYPEWLTINRLDDASGQPEYFVAVFSDITQIKSAQRKAEYLATHDALTGLPNRALFHDRLRHALARARREKHQVALLFIDLDNFKTINDTLGHDTGDALLKEAAERLRRSVRDVDTVARLGGDEFTAILAQSDAKSAAEVARRIIDELAASFLVAGRDLFVSASVGIALFPDNGADSSELIKAADTAMYRAKELGRNRFEFFERELGVRLMKRSALEAALRAALERDDRLRLVFQPKYRLSDRKLVGAEALLRWQDPELGNVSPGEFIPIAEGSGLILQLGQYVRDRLARQLREWLDLGLKPLPVACNVSPRCVREPGFAAMFLDPFDAAGIDHALVVVEITESALLEHGENVQKNLLTLAAAGLRLAIDDFGTGYSSLSNLKRLPLNELKIDKSFVDGLGSDPNDEAIALAILGLAQALGLQTVAEGVETQQQLAWLEAHGCDIAQGYLLGKPLEAEVFEDLLARHTKGQGS